jgi:AhpD family alkylhydroperoxidase
MKARIDYAKRAPGAFQAMVGLETYLRKCGLEASLLHLLKLRASQINGCAFCIDMHTDEALADGENPKRLFMLSVWDETPMFTEREQAALAWTEAVTLIADGGVSDDIYAKAAQHFSEEELVNLTLAVAAINAWNRFSITFKVPPALKGFQPIGGVQDE